MWKQKTAATEAPKKRGNGCHEYAARMMKLELRPPFKKSMPLVGLFNKSGEIISSPADVAHLLAETWYPMLAAQNTAWSRHTIWPRSGSSLSPC